MIDSDALEHIARTEQTNVFPNIVREYAQHIFLTELYRLPLSERLLFKGGTALRIVYGCPRFSEDLDFSLFPVPNTETQQFVETLFVDVLAEMERVGIHIEIGKSAPTSGGYFGIATLNVSGYPPITIEINVSSRTRTDERGEVDSITNNFVPTYTLYHLPQQELVEEKIFGALRERKKPRDYYDLYFLMRKNMLSADQKHRLAIVAQEIIGEARRVDFRGELGAFLPASQQAIVRDFTQTLEREMQNQLSIT
ncbi:MAG: nucleotidyl transferase AbiEii/AbiGii toxin family protein [Patescibacteria group bacterium]